MDFDGFRWFFEGFRRISKDFEGFRRISKDLEGFRRISMDFEGFSMLGPLLLGAWSRGVLYHVFEGQNPAKLNVYRRSDF